LQISGVLEEGSISELLAGEGTVGRYGELLKLGRRGDNLTPHHVPSNAYMAANVSGYTRNMGIAIIWSIPYRVQAVAIGKRFPMGSLQI